jgi:Domain of unknown function (DUF4178)
MAAPHLAGLACPNCGAAITIRAVQQTQTVVCPSCHAVLDSRDQQLSVLQQYQAKMTFDPDIPLGTRGVLRGDHYEVTGFQVRSVQQNDVEYFWREYTLWNPYKGYRYLAEYDGHWCDFDITRIAPSELVTGRQPFVRYQGTLFRHFRTTTITTVFILGEFPWQLRSGDRMTARDFIAPPRLLSEQGAAHHTVWELATYVPGDVIWRAFGRPGSPPPVKGVFAAEPNGHTPRAIRRAWTGAAPAALVVVAWLVRHAFAPRGSWLGASWPYALVLAACACPALLEAVRARQFERARWSASDYSPDEM